MKGWLDEQVKGGSHNRMVRLLVVCAAALTIAGCREEPTTVKGLVTLDGKPLTMREGMRGTVVFQPTVASGATLSGLIDASGHYQLASGGSAAVRPSVYWATVSATELVPPTDDRPSTGKLVTPAKYASATESGFRIEVLPGENEVNLPLASDVEPPKTNESHATPPGEENRNSVDSVKPNASESE